MSSRRRSSVLKTNKHKLDSVPGWTMENFLRCTAQKNAVKNKPRIMIKPLLPLASPRLPPYCLSSPSLPRSLCLPTLETSKHTSQSRVEWCVNSARVYAPYARLGARERTAHCRWPRMERGEAMPSRCNVQAVTGLQRAPPGRAPPQVRAPPKVRAEQLLVAVDSCVQIDVEETSTSGWALGGPRSQRCVARA